MRLTKTVACDIDIESLVEETLDYYLYGCDNIEDKIEELRDIPIEDFEYLDNLNEYTMTVLNADDYEFSENEYEAINAECEKYAKEYIKKQLQELTELLEGGGRG